jgi:hypothetical protein
MRDCWEVWATFRKVRRQYTKDRGYHSECVFVPRREIWSEIYRRFSGQVTGNAS